MIGVRSGVVRVCAFAFSGIPCFAPSAVARVLTLAEHLTPVWYLESVNISRAYDVNEVRPVFEGCPGDDARHMPIARSELR